MRLYRRHVPTCRHCAKGARYAACRCPIWVDATDGERRVRRSLGTRDWATAGRWLQAHGGEMAIDPELELAGSLYLADCQARGLTEGTLGTYDNTLSYFVSWALDNNITKLSGVTLEALTRWRAARKLKASSARKEIEHLRAWLSWCEDRGWGQAAPAKRLRPPKERREPTMPFTDEEVAKLLEACGRIENNYRAAAAAARPRARALVLLLLYSGLRISDAMGLRRTALGKDNRLLLRQEKTGHPVYLRLHAEAAAALRGLPVEGEYFLWSGRGRLSSAIGSARRTIDLLGKLAGVARAHPHRFRDTFAVGLLRGGADIRTVQLLLGHTSLRTTERHYAPWVIELQGRLDDAVERLDFGIGERPADAALGRTAEPGVHAGEDRHRNPKVLTLPRRRKA